MSAFVAWGVIVDPPSQDIGQFARENGYQYRMVGDHYIIATYIIEQDEHMTSKIIPVDSWKQPAIIQGLRCQWLACHSVS